MTTQVSKDLIAEAVAELIPQRIWALTTGGASPTIVAGNGLTVSRPASSRYRFTFDTEQPDTNYGVLVSDVAGGDRFTSLFLSNKTTTYFETITVNNSAAGTDPTGLTVEVLR